MIHGQLDFDIPATFLTTVGIAVLQPVYLFGATRIPALRSRNALQFTLSVMVMLTLWAAVVVWASPPSSIALPTIALDLMILGSGILFYLEVWGLMSRGYTLGVLLTLLNAGRPLREEEISRSYRGGEGLDWIMRHRMGGLIAAGLIEKRGDQLVLTPLKGLAVARLYQAGLTIVGLHETK